MNLIGSEGDRMCRTFFMAKALEPRLGARLSLGVWRFDDLLGQKSIGHPGRVRSPSLFFAGAVSCTLAEDRRRRLLKGGSMIASVLEGLIAVLVVLLFWLCGGTKKGGGA